MILSCMASWIWNQSAQEYTLDLEDRCRAFVRKVRDPKTRVLEIYPLSQGNRLYSANYLPKSGELLESGNYELFARHQDALESSTGIFQQDVSSFKSIFVAIQEKHLALDEES